MNILTVHCRYTQRGGEDHVREAERDLLRAYGHNVTEYVRENSEITRGSLSLALRTIWSRKDYDAIRRQIRTDRPDVVAVHNFFPLISPAVFYAAHAERIPVVLTLHNFRLLCPLATQLRDGHICRDCLPNTFQYPAIQHACYHGSRSASSVIAAMNAFHRLKGTWADEVDRFIALTGVMRDEFIAAGFPADRIAIKPNFTADPGPGPGDDPSFVFVGRLSKEKGVTTLLRAWKRLTERSAPLRRLLIVGSGPDELSLRAQASGLPNVDFLGWRPSDEVQRLVGAASALILPSLWNEPFGLTMIEAFALGTPVLASNLGAPSVEILPGINGALFPRDDEQALANLMLTWSPTPKLRVQTRDTYLRRYTPERNYIQLIDIYTAALQRFAQSSGA